MKTDIVRYVNNKKYVFDFVFMFPNQMLNPLTFDSQL